MQATDTFSHTTDPLSDHADWDENNNSTDPCKTDGLDLTPGTDTNKTHMCIWQTVADGVSQFGSFEWKNVFGDNGTVGVVMRQANASGTGQMYIPSVRWSGSAWQFYVSRYNGTSFGETIGTPVNITTPSGGDWFGFQVEGTGDSTEFRFWAFGASDPGDPSTWPTRDLQNDGNPSTAVDTGAYCGIHFYTATPAQIHEIDTWNGGDQAAATPFLPLFRRDLSKSPILQM